MRETAWIVPGCFAIVFLMSIWAIVRKAGYGLVPCLLAYVPGVNFVLYLVFAFGEWPIQKRLDAIIEGGLEVWAMRIGTGLQALQHPQPEIRRDSALELGRLGSQSAVIVSALGALLHDQDTEVRKTAVVALGQLVSNAKQTLNAYEQLQFVAE